VVRQRRRRRRLRDCGRMAATFLWRRDQRVNVVATRGRCHGGSCTSAARRSRAPGRGSVARRRGTTATTTTTTWRGYSAWGSCTTTAWGSTSGGFVGRCGRLKVEGHKKPRDGKRSRGCGGGGQ
jgi:hypothetical protein